ncbi:MAG TPA: GcrA family cell cycle regulator [Caulobacteraceae bacterium]|jgi:hypothetical protein
MKNRHTADIVSSWTVERERRAIRLFLHEGFTAAEVAFVLGGLTRAAVIGKMRRMGILKREHAQAGARGPRAWAATPRPQLERRLPPRWPPIPLPPLREIAPTGHPVRLGYLAEGACRWPIDDPGSGQMHRTLFCADPAEGGPYCAAHRTLSGRQPAAAANAS